MPRTSVWLALAAIGLAALGTGCQSHVLYSGYYRQQLPPEPAPRPDPAPAPATDADVHYTEPPSAVVTSHVWPSGWWGYPYYPYSYRGYYYPYYYPYYYGYPSYYYPRPYVSTRIGIGIGVGFGHGHYRCR